MKIFFRGRVVGDIDDRAAKYLLKKDIRITVSMKGLFLSVKGSKTPKNK